MRTNTRPCCGIVSWTLQQLSSASHRSPPRRPVPSLWERRYKRHPVEWRGTVCPTPMRSASRARHLTCCPPLKCGVSNLFTPFRSVALGRGPPSRRRTRPFLVLFCGTWTWSAFTALYPPSPCARAVRHLDVVLPLPPHHPPPHSFHANPPHPPQALF